MESPARSFYPAAAVDVVEALPVAIVVVGPAGRIEQVNRAAATLLGRAPADLVEQPLSALDHVWREDGAPRVLQDRRPLPDGRTVIVLSEVAASAATDGAARESERELRFVVDAVPALLAFVDTDARYVWANESYRRWFGQSPESIRGRHVREVLGEAAWEQIRPRIDRVLAGEDVRFDNQAVYRHGPSRYVDVAYLPQRDASGRVRGVVVMVNDVSQMKAAEQELKAADRRKDEFLAMLSHELRNPLAPILSAVEILRLADGRDADLAARYQTVIERQVQHMKRLLDDLLDVSRVSKGKIELRKELLDLGVVLMRAIEVSRPLIDDKGQVFRMRPARGPVLVDADPTRLVQVFGNLLNNAAKYSERGGRIDLEASIEDGEAIVSVRDWGVGMTPDLLESAFDLFVQETRSLDRAQGGLGIGLTMVRSLVTMHGGSVRAFSDGPGRGCEVVVRLPCALGAAPPAGADVPAEPPREPSD